MAAEAQLGAAGLVAIGESAPKRAPLLEVGRLEVGTIEGVQTGGDGGD